MVREQTESTPLGIFDCLSKGFSAVAQKPLLLLIPLLLDSFLWLGPRLSITPIASNLASRFGSIVGGTNENSAALFEQNVSEILGTYNLFAALSTWPLGTPSLVAGSVAENGPLGSQMTIDVQSAQAFLGLMFVLVLTGLLVGSLYLSLIARYVGKQSETVWAWIGRVWLHWARIVALAFVAVVAAFMASVPFFLALELIAMILAPLSSFVLLVGVAIAMWGLFHLFFATHGILLYEMGVLRAILTSVALIRQYRFSAVGLLLVAVVIGLGLTSVWNMPPSDSWMRFIAIIGNAFVNTGLVAATFVYYRERAKSIASAAKP